MSSLFGVVKHLWSNGSSGSVESKWVPEFGTLFQMKGNDLFGKEFDYKSLEGKVCLLVNVACDCGYTKSSYSAMSKLYDDLKDEGLVVIGYPSNQFGGQESRSPEEIKKFTEEKYNVSFPLMEKADVNGEKEQPVYTWLKQSFPGDITWNFAAKFLINQEGIPVARFEKESWSDIKNSIEQVIQAGKSHSSEATEESSKN